MAITYGIVEEIHRVGDACRVSYELAAYADTETDGASAVVLSVHDVTSDKERLCDLIDKCNEEKLSLIHMKDVVMDFLEE